MSDERHASTMSGYELEAELGRGATGIVFRAHRIDDSRVVALKVLDPALTGDERFRERFAREADIMGRIESDHCVAVFDHGQDATAAWIAMEYVHGATLRAVLTRAGRLTPAQACGVLLGALAGLARAHALGLIHRDFKPDNILVDASGVSKLADFGLVADRLDTGAWRPIEGSPAYMSPEQVRGEVLDPRSDIYAAGAVLFELLSGHPPFTGDSPLATLHAQVESPPPSAEGLPQRIGSVVLWALSKTRDDRPATAQELAAAIREAADRDLGVAWIAAAGIGGLVAGAVGADATTRDCSSAAARHPTVRRRRSLWLAGAVAIAAAVVVFVIGFSGANDGTSKHASTRRQRRPAVGTTTSTLTAVPAGPVDTCLVGSWHAVTATGFYNEFDTGRKDITSGGAGIVRVVRADGTDTVDYNASAPFLGTASGGPLTQTFRGTQSGSLVAHAGTEHDTAAADISHLTMTAQINGATRSNTTVLASSTDGTFSCTATTWVEQNADGTTATWAHN
jgi:Serine/threonine protein kinase